MDLWIYLKIYGFMDLFKEKDL